MAEKFKSKKTRKFFNFNGKTGFVKFYTWKAYDEIWSTCEIWRYDEKTDKPLFLEWMDFLGEWGELDIERAMDFVEGESRKLRLEA